MWVAIVGKANKMIDNISELVGCGGDSMKW
jgi:hypothetical protein